MAEWAVPNGEMGSNQCVGRHTAFMAIRYNLWFP
jgi:hypothetical protein